MDLCMAIKGRNFIETEGDIVGSGEVNERRQRVGEQKRAEHQRISVDEAARLHRRAKQHCGGTDKKERSENPGARRIDSLAPHQQGHGDEQDDREKKPAPRNCPRLLFSLQHALSATSSFLFSAKTFSLKSSTNASAMARTMLGRNPHSDGRRTPCCVVR